MYRDELFGKGIYPLHRFNGDKIDSAPVPYFLPDAEDALWLKHQTTPVLRDMNVKLLNSVVCHQ